MSTETEQSAMPPTEPSATAAAPGAGGPETAFDQLQSDLDRFRDLALRSQADFENYRKRSIREKEEAVRFANFSLVERLIPILDNFELGLAAARAAEGAATIVDGMDMVRRQLADVLQQHGVEVVEAEGLPFDPNLHEAVAQEVSASVSEGSVIRQLRKGYRLKDRLVRAALVVISSGSAA